jgi:hypothetical protein
VRRKSRSGPRSTGDGKGTTNGHQQYPPSSDGYPLPSSGSPLVSIGNIAKLLIYLIGGITLLCLVGRFARSTNNVVNAVPAIEGVPRRQGTTRVDPATSVFERSARQLVNPNFIGFEVTEVKPNLGGVVVRYDNRRLRAPPLAVSIQYMARPPDRAVPRGFRSIRVAGHRGIRAETDGYSILNWWSGRWIFTLATTSDQRPGDIHVVDAFAHQVATYADARAEIRLTTDAGEVQAALNQVAETERRLALEAVRVR